MGTRVSAPGTVPEQYPGASVPAGVRGTPSKRGGPLPTLDGAPAGEQSTSKPSPDDFRRAAVALRCEAHVNDADPALAATFARVATWCEAHALAPEEVGPRCNAPAPTIDGSTERFARCQFAEWHDGPCLHRSLAGEVAL